MNGHLGYLRWALMVLLSGQSLWASGFSLSVDSEKQSLDRFVAQTLIFEEDTWAQLEFEYQFVQDGGGELWIYLTNDLSLDEAQLTPIIKLTAPDDERLGSPGSDAMSVFQGDVWIDGYPQGTELSLIFELQGQGTVCLIQSHNETDNTRGGYLILGGVGSACGVTCGFICGDFNGDNAVTEADYLLLVSQSGRAVDEDSPCLDLAGDGFVDLLDILALDMAFHQLNVCGSGRWDGDHGFDGLDGFYPKESPCAGFWLVGGKSNGEGDQSDWLYGIDCNGLSVTEPFTAPLMDEEDVPRGYGRLVQDGRGGLYQIHGVHGLVDLQSQTVVVPGQMATWQGRPVRVGVVDEQGRGLLDVAFDPCDPHVVYVVPVQVWSPLSQCPYRAAARLVLDGNEPYQVTQIYGLDPMEDPNVTVTSYGCGATVLEPDVQQLRELELDDQGHLFVISSQQVNDNDWVLVYDVNQGNASERRFCISEVIEGPGATLLSSGGQSLYLASSIEPAPGSAPAVTRYAIERSGECVVGLTPEAQTLLLIPADALGANGYALITSLAETEDGVVALGFAAQRWDGREPFVNDDALLTQPFMASVPAEMPEAVSVVMIEDADMALPLTATWMAGDD